MHLASDYIHPTPHGGRCRIRIYLPDEERDAVVVICSELPSNPGMSVTNAVMRVAAEVIESHHLPTPLVWIEHYEADRGVETFDLVLFDSYEAEKPDPCILAAGRWRSVVPPGRPSTGPPWRCW